MLRRPRRIADLGAGSRLTGTLVEFAVLTGDQGFVGEVLMHPGQVIVTAFHNPLGVPQRHVLLFEMLLHQRWVDLVHVMQPHDHTV